MIDNPVFDWLTEDQKTVLLSDNVTVKWDLRLTTWSGEDLGDFTEYLVLSDSYIERDATEQIQGKGHLVLETALNWKNSLACPMVTIIDIDTEIEATWVMGLWTFRNPGRSLENSQLWETDIADIIDYMGVQTGVSWTVRDGVNIGNAVADVIRAPYSNIPYNLPLIPWEVGADAMWPITKRAMWIEIANELLEASAHASLYADRYGTLKTYPWEPIDNVVPVWKFSESEEVCWLREDCYREPPPSAAPNKWIGINRSVENPFEGNGVYTIDNSGVNRIIPNVFEVNASDQVSLVSMVRRARQDDIQQENRLNLRSGLTPVFWHGDVVEVCLPRLGAGSSVESVRGMVIGWRMDMDDPDMTLIVEVVP